MNIVLIGPRGVGKSTLASMLSALTKRPVVATDQLIVLANHGLSIPEILQQHHGDWRLFRDMEHAVVQQVAQQDGVIIDTGGGVVVDLDEAGNEYFSQRKMTALKRNGFVVWLTGDLGRLARNVATDANRPRLSTEYSEEEIMRRREPFYRQVADLTVNTKSHSRWTECADFILKQFSLVA